MTFALEPQSIDTLIASRMPPWLMGASVEHLTAFRRALRSQQLHAERLKVLLRSIPALDVFAEQRLVQALASRGVPSLDVRRATLRITRQLKAPSVGNSLPGPFYPHVSRQSLLGALLHNFHVAETRPSFLRSGLLRDAQGKALPMGFEAFAGLCRQLDVGKAYQSLLQQRLRPDQGDGQSPGAGCQAVNRLFEDSLRSNLEVDVRASRLKDDLDETSYLQLLPVFAHKPVVPPVAATLLACQPYLLGKRLRGVVGFEVREPGGSDVAAVLLWIPGDPARPLQRHASWEAFYRAQAASLRDNSYQTFFLRFVSQRDRPAFAGALRKRLAASSAADPVELDGRALPIKDELFAYLRQQHIDTLFDDARILAVPTGDEDEDDRRERLDNYLSLGMDVLGMAGLFVPLLGQTLLAIGVMQIANEVFEGFEDWQIGDRQGAIGHVLNIAEQLTLGAAVSVGAAALAKRLPRLDFVDALAPVRLDNGELRLMDPQLSGYAQPDAADGIVMEHTRYVMSSDSHDGSARLLHPSRREAYSPRLEDNGTSGWRHELERPQGWQGPRQLLRRFGDGFADIPERVAEDLLQITGLSEDHLRRLHLESAAAPARLADLVDLYRLHEAQPGLEAAALEEQQRLRQGSAAANERVLMGSFPGLTLRTARQLLEHAATADIEQLTRRQRVPLSIAEHARWALRQRRLDRACAGLRWPWLAGPDSEQLALGLLDSLAPWPDSVRLEVRESAGEGRLLASLGRLEARDVRAIVRSADGYRPSGVDTASLHLIGALQHCLSEPQRLILGQSAASEATLLAKVASAIDRDLAASLLGMAGRQPTFAPPRRFADGRLGYALSGRGGGERQALRRGIHQIYPTLGDSQLNAYLESLSQRGVGLWEHYTQLQDQLSRLRQALANWQRNWSNPLDALRRRRVANAIRRSWRRKVTDRSDDFVLLIDGESVGSLPSLPDDISFAHIRRLCLRNMGLETIDNEFLQRFENLVELDLSGNRLDTVAQVIGQMTHLRVLRLANNQITLTAASERILGALRGLEFLDLSHNPLGRAPVLTHLRRLRDVRLRNAGLESLPDGISWRGTVDVRDNRIRQLRQDLVNLREQMEQVALHDNPLDEASEALADSASGHVSGGRGSPSFQHSVVDISLRDAWVGNVSTQLRERRRGIWAALQDEPGSSDLFRFLADFIDTEDMDAHPQFYRKRVWRILEACEQHADLRQRLFMEAAGPGTCEDRLLLVLEQMEVAVLAERALAQGPGSRSEASLVELGRGLFRLDEVDRIASRHIAQMRAQAMPLVDDIEVRLFYRLRLMRPLELPIADDEMHYDSFAHVTTRQLSAAQREVLAVETPSVLADSIAQRPFWAKHARELHSIRFDNLADQFHGRLEALQSQVERQMIDEWTYEVRSRGLKYEYEIAEHRLLRTLAEEALRRAS
ncbi:NEL-type E3 ubiquitin ligase domain-containing protein [uncultured Pseudomonas sp.]|uniref:NEL-type E3 ubiquitin ligase domain-containing protein n=1 Tax=uncultured Pseudomonas sp. TaxID=114707 RepID=UPI0025EB92F5|nr:NEL-type E3 ubiquitin ligase domain-containing protein [uncultured Pseudomonas sp.]